MLPLRSPSCTLPLMLCSMKAGTLSFLSMTNTSTVKLWRCTGDLMFWGTSDGLKDTCRPQKQKSQSATSPWDSDQTLRGNKSHKHVCCGEEKTTFDLQRVGWLFLSVQRFYGKQELSINSKDSFIVSCQHQVCGVTWQVMKLFKKKDRITWNPNYLFKYTS